MINEAPRRLSMISQLEVARLFESGACSRDAFILTRVKGGI